MKIKELRISERKEYSGNGDIVLNHLDDTKKCHIMTSNYGEVTSASLNKTQVKRVIKWLEKWVKMKEAGA